MFPVPLSVAPPSRSSHEVPPASRRLDPLRSRHPLPITYAYRYLVHTKSKYEILLTNPYKPKSFLVPHTEPRQPDLFHRRHAVKGYNLCFVHPNIRTTILTSLKWFVPIVITSSSTLVNTGPSTASCSIALDVSSLYYLHGAAPKSIGKKNSQKSGKKMYKLLIHVRVDKMKSLSLRSLSSVKLQYPYDLIKYPIPPALISIASFRFTFQVSTFPCTPLQHVKTCSSVHLEELKSCNCANKWNFITFVRETS